MMTLNLMVGYEFEFLVREGGHPLSRETFLAFHKMLEQDGWRPDYDRDTERLYGSSKDGVVIISDDSVSIMEINLPPTETVGESDKKITVLLKYLQKLFRKLGCTIIGTSVYPGAFDLYHPKCREKCENPYVCAISFINYIVPKKNHEYHHATFVMAANQIWLDLPKNKINRQLNVFNRLSPLFLALFANGPVFNEKAVGVYEGRDVLWHIILDHGKGLETKKKYGMYFKEPLSIFDYFDAILDSPHYFGYRDGRSFKLVDPKKTYRDLLFSPATEAVYGKTGEKFFAKPELIDFKELQHATYPYVRLKFFIGDSVSISQILAAYQKKNEKDFLACFSKFCMELRVISAQKKGDLSIAPALVLGLQENIEEVKAFVLKRPYAFWTKLYSRAQKKGLEDQEIKDLAEELVALAMKGLKKRNQKEEHFLVPLQERLASGQNPAQELLEIWEGQGLPGIYQARDY